MASRSTETKIFEVLLPPANNGTKESLKEELSKIFALLKRTANSIIDSAPIVILDDASENEAYSLQRHFKDAADTILKIHPLGELNGQIHRLSWSNRPDIIKELRAHSDFSHSFGEIEFVNPEAEIKDIVFDDIEIDEPVEEIKTEDIPASAAAQSPKPASQQRQIPDFMNKQEDGADEFVYNVFLSGTPTKSKRQKAIELLCELKGISELEANEFMSRTVVPIAKGLTKAQSDEIQKIFHDSRINIRVMKKQKS